MACLLLDMDQRKYWKYSSKSVIASYLTPEGTIRLVTYSPCECREKYKFKRNSSLLRFLQTCEGWVNDPEGYTLNYVMIVLIAMLKDQRSLYFSKKYSKHYVPLHIGKLLGFEGHALSDIRSHIANQHLQNYPQNSYLISPYFTCPHGAEEVITSLLGPQGSLEDYFDYHSTN